MDLLPFILAIVILVLVDLAAMRYGADSRGGFRPDPEGMSF